MATFVETIGKLYLQQKDSYASEQEFKQKLSTVAQSLYDEQPSESRLSKEQLEAVVVSFQEDHHLSLKEIEAKVGRNYLGRPTP